MATELKLRRGTTVQHSTFTGASGEVTVDTTKHTAVVHDGATAGGFPLLKESAIGTTVQAQSSNLSAYAAVTPTAAGLALLDDADAAAQRTTLGLGTAATTAATAYATAAQGTKADSALQPAAIGTTVQAYSANTPTTAASQAEMEAGSETGLRSMSPLRIAQAIAALAGTPTYSAGTYYQSIYPAVFSDAGDGVAGVSASSVVLGESSTIGQFGSPGTVYVERLNVRMLASGTFRVSFGLGRASGTAGARIYKNGVAFGTDRSTTTGTVASPVTFTEDLAFTAGDTLQIFMKNTASANTGIFAPKIGVSIVPKAPIFNTLYVGER